MGVGAGSISAATADFRDTQSFHPGAWKHSGTARPRIQSKTLLLEIVLAECRAPREKCGCERNEPASREQSARGVEPASPGAAPRVFHGEAVGCLGVCGKAGGQARRLPCEKQVRVECQHRPHTRSSTKTDAFSKHGLKTSSEHLRLHSKKQARSRAAFLVQSPLAKTNTLSLVVGCGNLR